MKAKLKDLQELAETVCFFGEDDTYTSFIADVLFPAMAAYVHHIQDDEERFLGTVSLKEFLTKCQLLELLLLELKKFTDKYPEGVKGK